MVPLKLFESRTFAGTNLLTLFLYAALSAALFFFPLNLIQVQGYTSDIAGLTLLPFALLIGLIAPFSGGMVNRFGARRLLTIGPAVTGFGFLALALPGLTNGMADYWLTYFPGQLLLGIGMGITVAPLTTAVMGSAPDEQAGTASGINNAVSRTAGVLAIAVLGSVALVTFSGALTSRTDSINMTADERTALHAQAANLAETQPPASLDAATTAEVEAAIDWAFVDTFRLMQIIAAVLAWISALVAFVFVAGDHRHEDHQHKARPVIYPCEGRDTHAGRKSKAGATASS
jgi:MFS family permease